MFSRVHELYPDSTPRVSLIYVSRSLDWMERLDKATLDTVGRVSGIQLQQYDLSELRDILSYRAEEAFKPGTVSEDVLFFIADIAISYGGVRYGLELLMEAGGQAEADLADSVRAGHVRRAHVNIPKGVNGAYYPSELSLHKQLLLKGLINSLQSRSGPYISYEDAYDSYRLVCERCGREAEDNNVIKSYLTDLSAEGYILLKRYDDTVSVGMEFPFNRLAKVLDETLKKALKES